MLSARPSRRSHGFTLIELMVGLAIVAFMLLATGSGLRQFAANSRTRAAAENLAALLQSARSDAIRRNADVEFLATGQALGSTGVDAFTPSAGGRNWIVRTRDPATDAGTAYELLAQQSGSEASAGVVISALTETTSAPVQSIHFTNLGQISVNGASGGSDALKEAAVFDVSNPTGGSCAADGGPMRCLRVRVSVSGEVRLCDPAATGSDSRKC